MITIHPKSIPLLKKVKLHPIAIYIDVESRRVFGNVTKTSTNSLRRSKSFILSGSSNGSNGNYSTNPVFSTQRSRLDTWNKFKNKYKLEFDSILVIRSLDTEVSDIKDTIAALQAQPIWDSYAHSNIVSVYVKMWREIFIIFHQIFSRFKRPVDSVVLIGSSCAIASLKGN